MKHDYYIHWIWLIWLIILTQSMFCVPTELRVRNGKKLETYQAVKLLQVGKDPYMRLPIVINMKEKRNWYYMKAVDQARKKSSVGVNADALSVERI